MGKNQINIQCILRCKLSDDTEIEESTIIGVNPAYYKWSYMSRVEEYAIESQYERVEVIRTVGSSEKLPKMIYRKEVNKIVVEWIWK